MKTLEMEIAIPEVYGGRCVSVKLENDCIIAKFEIGENETSSISESKLECKIDPNTFAGDWLNYKPTTKRQKEILTLYQDAKAKGRLHTFTCMTIDPSIKDGKVVYEKGLPPKTGLCQNQWKKMLKDYKPNRNSRQMTRTEYACRNLYLIERLVKSGYEVKEAWEVVCDDSKKLGHYYNSDNFDFYLEPTGSRKICGFCDLGNTMKFLAEDPWEETGGFWIASGCCRRSSIYGTVATHYRSYDVCSPCNLGVGMAALD